MMLESVPMDFIESILDYLGVKAAPPTLHLLDDLVAAYVQRIPWESASRIVRRQETLYTQDCPRWPDTFWHSAITQGTGGTCFESNYAFFHLLESLGYTGYLTINNMGDTIGCHTAIVITLDEGAAAGRYLVDVGLPVHRPLPLDTAHQTIRNTPYHAYTATPTADDSFTITRDRHPRPYCFTLIDQPVTAAAYRQALTADYEPGSGLFLDQVIVVRVVNGFVHRFSDEGAPYHIERFHDGDKTYYYLGDDRQQTAAQVTRTFGIAEAVVYRAMQAVKR